MRKPSLVIACGALAREITAIKRSNGWQHLHLKCIDARLHNRPALIAERLQHKIRENSDRYENIFVAYAECGTVGEIDRVIREEGVERLPGAHCYQFFAGHDRFEELSAAEPGTFYLTDFLAQHFERLVVRELKIDKYPQLKDDYFGNYRRVVYLSQVPDDRFLDAAMAAASFLGLEFERIHCGYGLLQTGLESFVAGENHG